MTHNNPGTVLTAADLLLTAQSITATMNVSVQLAGMRTTLDDLHWGATETAVTAYGEGRYVIRLPYGGRFAADIDMYLRGFLDHECGHVRFTNFERVTEFCMNMKEFPNVPYDLVARLYNIFEDVRIERLMSEMYPGCRTNLRRLNVALFPEDTVTLPKTFTEPGDEVVASYVYDLLANAAVAFTLRHALGLLYNENFHARAYREEIDKRFGHPQPGTYEHDLVSYVFTVSGRLAEDAARARTMDDVETCVRGMCALLSSLFQHITKSVNEPPNCAAPGGGLQMDTPEAQQTTEQNHLQRLADSLENGAENKHGRLAEEMNRRVLRQAGRAPKAIEAEVRAATALADEMQRSATGFVKRVRPWRMQGDFKWQAKTRQERLRIEAIASRCRCLFQSLLETLSYRREKVGYFGRGLDTRRLWRSRIGDGRLFRTRSERHMLDTDVCLLADASGSMQHTIDDCMLVLHGIVRALRPLSHVRSAASIFNGNSSLPFMPWDGEIPPMSVGVKAECTTPMAGALLNAIISFPPSGPDTRRIVFLLTDGDPDSDAAMRLAVEAARKRGFELYGIGIGVTRINEFLGDENTCAVDTIDELLPALERMLMLAFARRMAA